MKQEIHKEDFIQNHIVPRKMMILCCQLRHSGYIFRQLLRAELPRSATWTTTHSKCIAYQWAATVQHWGFHLYTYKPHRCNALSYIRSALRANWFITDASMRCGSHLRTIKATTSVVQLFSHAPRKAFPAMEGIFNEIH